MKLPTFVMCLALTFFCACTSTNAEVRQEEKIVTDKKVEVFVTDWCPFCQRLEKFLKSKGIPYIRHNIDTDSEGAKIHQEISKNRGIPVTRIGSTVIQGYSPKEILDALK